MWDKKNIAIGIMFALFSVFCGATLLKGERDSFLITGVFVFAIVAIAFLKRAKR